MCGMGISMWLEGSVVDKGCCFLLKPSMIFRERHFWSGVALLEEGHQ